MALILTFIRSMQIILLDSKQIISVYMITFCGNLYVIRKTYVATFNVFKHEDFDNLAITTSLYLIV